MYVILSLPLSLSPSLPLSGSLSLALLRPWARRWWLHNACQRRGRASGCRVRAAPRTLTTYLAVARCRW